MIIIQKRKKVIKEMEKNILKKIPKKIRDKIIFITSQYKQYGYDVYLVGGSLRDILLNITPKDFDLSTNAPLNITSKIFEKVVPTGEKHGTLTIIIDNDEFEITRFRQDVSCDGRNATIKFAETIEEDLSRRDFTINALAFDLNSLQLIDLFGGIKDLSSSRLRFVGKPEERVKEDYLRALRLLRFSTKLNFVFDNDDFEKVLSVYDHNMLSLERIYQETNKMFGNSSKEIIDKYKKLGVFCRFFPQDINNIIIDKMFETRDYFPLVYQLNGDYSTLKLSKDYKLFYNVFKKFENKKNLDIRDTKELISLANNEFFIAEHILKYFNVLGYENLYKSGKKHLNIIRKQLLSGNEIPISMSDLAISGTLLLSKGLKGKEIGNKMQELLDKVRYEPRLNKRDILLSLI